MSEQPLVSILMPSYNHEQFVGEAIESVLAQTYPRIELIACDDASTDDTGRIIAEYARRYPERITAIHHRENRGVPETWNDCLRVSRGTLVVPFASDDRFPPTAMDARVSYLMAHQEVDVLATDFSLVTETGDVIEGIDKLRAVPQFTNTFRIRWDNLYNELLPGNFVPGNTVMIRLGRIQREAITEDPLCPNLSDYDLWLRLAQSYRWGFLPVSTCHYRWHGQNYSSPINRMNDQSVVTRQAIYILAKQLNRHPTEAQRRMIERFILLYSGNLVGVVQPQPGPVQAVTPPVAPAPSPVRIAPTSAPLFTASIIIPVFNKVELTAQCLTKLAEVTTDPDFEVIIVDNHSTDGTEAFLKQLGGDVRVIRNEDNLGFAKACNQGAQAARGRYLVFLNNDTIPLRGWLKAMVDEVETHPEVGIVGSKLLYANETIQHAGVVFDRTFLTPYHAYRTMPHDHPAVNKRREFRVVTGACMLVRRELFDAIGGFDEAFRNGFEDVDFCLKAGDRGHRVVYQPKSVVFHLESQSPGRKLHDHHNSRLFQARWGERWWLADEDRIYHEDGFKCIHGTENDTTIVSNLRLLADRQDQLAWGHVAAVERAAAAQDWATARRALADSKDWPDDPAVISWAVSVCRWLGESALAEQYRERGARLRSRSDGYLEAAKRCVEERRFQDAEREIKALLLAEPNHREGWLIGGVLAMQRNDFREADSAFASAMVAGADRGKCLKGRGMARFGLKDAGEAWEQFAAALRHNADDAEAVHWLLRAGTALARWNELSAALSGFVAKHPEMLDLRFALAGVLVRADRLDEARREYETVRAQHPAFDGLQELERAISEREGTSPIPAQAANS